MGKFFVAVCKFMSRISVLIKALVELRTFLIK